MFKRVPGPLTLRHVGILFLIFGLVMGLAAWASADFWGGMMGFWSFAIVFGLLMMFLPFGEKKI